MISNNITSMLKMKILVLVSHSLSLRVSLPVSPSLAPPPLLSVHPSPCRSLPPAPAEVAQCYLIAPVDGRCGGRVLSLTQELCCCTVGKSWGKNCERCPEEDTGERTSGPRVLGLIFRNKCSLTCRAWGAITSQWLTPCRQRRLVVVVMLVVVIFWSLFHSSWKPFFSGEAWQNFWLWHQKNPMIHRDVQAQLTFIHLSKSHCGYN